MKAALQKLSLFMAILLLVIVTVNLVAKNNLADDAQYAFDAKIKNIVLGHSHTECGLNDSLIDNTINLSQGGESYFYTYQKIRKLVAANPQVKTVFISYANNQISDRMDKWVWDEKYLDNNFPKYSFMMDWEDYRSVMERNATGVLQAEVKVIKNFISQMRVSQRNVIADRSWGGYNFLKRNKVDSLLKTDYLAKEKRDINLKVSAINVDYLKKIVDFCRDHSVDLYFLRMPVRPEMPFFKNEAQYDSIKKVRFSEVTLLDFKRFPTPAEDCGDFDHLNHNGARKFSVFFNNLLRNGLLKSANKQIEIDAAIAALTSKDPIR